MNSNQTIRNHLMHYKENELIFASELYKTKLYNSMTEAAFYKALERMCKAGELVKIAKGTYHLPKINKYGIVPPSDKDIILSFTKNNTGVIVGYSLYNSLNLTTQVPKTIDVYSSTSNSTIKTIRNISIHKVNINYSEEINKMIQSLDVLQNYYNIQDINNSAFIRFTKEIANNYSEEIFENVTSTIPYKKSTIAFLREILNFYGIKNNLDSYLSSLSEYKYPKMEEIYETARISR